MAFNYDRVIRHAVCCTISKVYPIFIPHHVKKCGVLCYTLHSKTCVECPSVHQSLRAWFSLSMESSILPIFFNLGIRFDIGKECLEIADG